MQELVPTDVHQLSDPYCILKLVSTRFDVSCALPYTWWLPDTVALVLVSLYVLWIYLFQGTELRTKTVHKTIHPVFNETLTFYGITQTDLAWTSLQIHVMGKKIIKFSRYEYICIQDVYVKVHSVD